MSINKNKGPASPLASEKDHLSNVSVDCVVFGYHHKELKVLCSKISGVDVWALPGGHVKTEENLEEAAHRVLERRTGVSGLFLKQFQTFGRKDRSFRNTALRRHLQTLPAMSAKKVEWIFTNRFVSVCYYALTEFSKVTPQPGFFDSRCQWMDANDLPELILDHEEMVREALKTLRLQLHHEPIGLNLLPAKFTLPELQALYETLLGKKLDQRNFTKKLASLDVLKKLDEKRHIGGHRAPTLYKFNRRAYNRVLKEEMTLIF